MRYSKNLEFWLSSILLILTIAFSFVAYYRWYSLTIFVGPYLLSHWLSLIGIIFITAFTPFYYILKRKKPKNCKTLLRIHVFGNLFSFLLISVHFAQHVGRLALLVQKLGTGVFLFLILNIIVVTGILERFQIARRLKKHTIFLHRYILIIFYFLVFIHTLQGLNFI